MNQRESESMKSEVPMLHLYLLCTSFCRFDQYESFDSRSSALGPRDLYRSGNIVFGDSRGDMMAQRGGMGFGAMGGAGGGGGFGSSASHGNAKMRQARDPFSGSSWGAGQRSQHRGGGPGGRGFGRRQDSSMMGGGGRSGGQGHSPSGRGKLPSLLSHRMYPESGGFQPHHGSQDYPARHFGGGKNLNRQRPRKRPLNRVSTSSKALDLNHQPTPKKQTSPACPACRVEIYVEIASFHSTCHSKYVQKVMSAVISL